MSDRSNSFRTSLSGFHKGDVAKYIEKTAAQHRAKISEKDKIIAAQEQELQSLRKQLELLMMASPETPAPQAPTVDDLQHISDFELQAYRRAEAAERLAYNRARKIYAGLETTAEDTLRQFKTVDAAVKQAVDTILSQNTLMEEAYSALAVVLTESQQQLTQIDPLIAETDSEEI